MHRLIAAALVTFGLLSAAGAAETGVDMKHYDWSFSGPLGSYDEQQLQRGFKVYREVCSSCHALSLIRFRNLAEEGGPAFTEAQVKALAAEYQVIDAEPDELGDPVEREGKPFDAFPSPFPNENAARASNNGAYPPDFSLLAKSRATARGFPWFIFDVFTQYQENGPDYVTSLLTGYPDGPDTQPNEDGLYPNPYFLGGPNGIAMAPPLADGIVSYFQNTDEDALNDVPETVEQYSKDIAAFMMWAAEPKLEQRKATGLVVMIFLIVFAVLLQFTRKKVWAGVKGADG